MTVSAGTGAAVAAAWAATLLTRLPPGLLEAGACRVFASTGLRATAIFLGGVAVADGLAGAALVQTGWISAEQRVPPLVSLAAGALICTIALRRLTSRRPATAVVTGDGWPLLAGVRAAFGSPGWWNWWLLVGSAMITAGASTPVAVSTGLLAGIVTWGTVVLVAIRAGRRHVAGVGARRWELVSGWLLLASGLLLTIRTIL